MKKMYLKRMLSKALVTMCAVSSLLVCVPQTANAGSTLLDTYGYGYGYSGTCINLYQLRDANTLATLKKDYNSITLENEMKPDALLGSSARLITVSEAKNRGYYIPSNYKESTVPTINFNTVDEVMKICYNNGLKMRAHTLVWHSQTPSWFFRNGYSGGGSYVNSSTMDARLEMYIKTVMNHVYSNQYGSVVYAWDVANEYLHATNSGWEAVYGKCGTSPAFLKKAFTFADETLAYYKLQDSVKLFYNDYNTYMEVNDAIKLINYINSDKKVCDGIGMQSHLGTNYPSVDYYTSALKSFCQAGFEVQITEMDITNKGDSDLSNYAYQLFKNINNVKKSGGNITGVTWWGLSDQTTWINNAKPLLHSTPGVTKPAYSQVVKAYNEVLGSYKPSGTTPVTPDPGSNSGSGSGSESGSGNSGNSGNTGNTGNQGNTTPITINSQTLSTSVVNGSYVKGDNENNPIASQAYNADPGVMVYNDTVYIYATNDIYEYSNGQIGENTYGKIQSLNCYSSKDLVNWTDHGSIQVAGNGGAARWASNSWAPCATYKTINGKTKFFLYFANNASSIGVLTADSPTGPWSDPIGKAIVDRSTPNCSGVTWMFDPAVLVDSDGTGYLYFGGGIPSGQSANPKTARVIKLNSSMTGTVGSAATIDAPYLFEDSGINKIGNTYYYSYCSNWNCSNGFNNAAIEYMTSSSPMGPFTYKGEIMKNPGVFFQGSTGNNHHSIFEFKGNYYMAYHTRAVESKVVGKSLGYRSTQINKISVSGGKINSLTPNMSGEAQTSYVNPYETVQAETMFTQAGIKVAGTGDTYVTDTHNGDFTKVKGVNFSNGLSKITVNVRANSNTSIEVRAGGPNGTLIGTINVSNTNGSFKDFSASMPNVTGVQNIVFLFKGSLDFNSWTAGNGTSSGSGNQGGQTQPTQPTEPTQPTQPTGQTATIADGWYYIKNVNAQKYLTVADNNGKAGQNVELRTGSGADGQKWKVTNLSNGNITLTSKLGNFMLDVANGSSENGTNIIIYNGYSGDAQQYQLKATNTANTYVIATKASNFEKCLDDYEKKTADGTNVCQWAYNGGANQQFVFEKADDSQQSQPTQPTQPTEPTQPTQPTDPTPAAGSMKLDYSINSWGTGYTVNLKVVNETGAQVNTWTLKLKKSEVKIDSSWNVNVKESGDYYVITPVSWNSQIANGGSIEFGICGNGSIGNSLSYSFE